MKDMLTGDEERVLMKIVVRAEDERVVGVHIVGPDAPEIIQAVAIAVKMGATKADFDRTCALASLDRRGAGDDAREICAAGTEAGLSRGGWVMRIRVGPEILRLEILELRDHRPGPGRRVLRLGAAEQMGRPGNREADIRAAASCCSANANGRRAQAERKADAEEEQGLVYIEPGTNPFLPSRPRQQQRSSKPVTVIPACNPRDAHPRA